MTFQVRVWGWVHAGWLALTLAPRPPPGLPSTCGLVAMTSASHAEGRQFDPGQVYFTLGRVRENYTWPGSNWRPSACEADVIATRPQVPWKPLPNVVCNAQTEANRRTHKTEDAQKKKPHPHKTLANAQCNL